MRCHYIYDKKAGKVWIPSCWGGLYGPEGCNCGTTNLSFTQFEKKLFNEKMAEVRKENNELQKEIFRLNRVIKKLINGKKKTS